MGDYPASFDVSLRLSQVLFEEVHGERQRPIGLRLGVGLAAVTGKGVVGAGIFVDGHQRIGRQAPLQHVVDLGLHPAILHRHVQNERTMEILRLDDAVLDVGAVIGHRAVDVGPTAHQVAELAAEAVANRADLAVAHRNFLEAMPSVLHIADAEVVVELVIEIERLLHMVGVRVGEFNAWLLPPEQVGDETHEARFGELVGVMAHGVVDAPDFHDGDDRAHGRLVGIGDIGAHRTVAKFDLDVFSSHSFPCLNLSFVMRRTGLSSRLSLSFVMRGLDPRIHNDLH